MTESAPQAGALLLDRLHKEGLTARKGQDPNSGTWIGVQCKDGTSIAIHASTTDGQDVSVDHAVPEHRSWLVTASDPATHQDRVIFDCHGYPLPFDTDTGLVVRIVAALAGEHGGCLTEEELDTADLP